MTGRSKENSGRSAMTLREMLRYQEMYAEQLNTGVINETSLVIERKDIFSNTA